MGSNLYIYTDREGYKRRDCRICQARRARDRYWGKLKAAYHPRNKPGRPRKYE